MWRMSSKTRWLNSRKCTEITSVKQDQRLRAIASCYANGERVEAIAARYGIAAGSVYQYAYMGGADKRKRAQRIVNQPPSRSQELTALPSPEAQRGVCRRKIAGELVRDLAKEVGVSRQTIYNWLKKFSHQG